MSLVRFENNSPFADLLGIEVVREDSHEVELRMPFIADLQNRKGDVHGGAIASLVDTGLGMAALYGLDRSAAASTLSLTINFLSAARSDLRCVARCTRRGRSIRFVECKVSDAADELVATAVGTFKIYPGRKAE